MTATRSWAGYLTNRWCVDDRPDAPDEPGSRPPIDFAERGDGARRDPLDARPDVAIERWDFHGEWNYTVLPRAA
jgi:hypothetical protein